MVLPSLQQSSPEVPSPEPQGRVVMTKVFVTGLKVAAEIGVYAHEKGMSQPLIVDVELDVPTAGATRLADTVNYETIGESARDIAAAGHIQLVEDFAERLARACGFSTRTPPPPGSRSPSSGADGQLRRASLAAAGRNRLDA